MRALLRRLVPALIPLAGRLGQRVARALARRAYVFPARHRAPVREREVLRTAAREWVEFRGRRIAVWRWGEGPAVLLAHGWSGRGGQLAAFVEPLVGTGFSVVAWDAPGHGRSRGRRTTLGEFVQVVAAMARRQGRVHAVIGHSLGAVAAALACADGAPIERVVLVGGTADPRGCYAASLASLGLAPGSRPSALACAEVVHGIRWEDADVRARVTRLAGVRALVVHDRRDAEVRFADGVRVAAAWPGARLLATDGLGHHRILREPAVVAEVARFVCEGTGRTFRSEAEVIEMDLWERRVRWRTAPEDEPLALDGTG